MTFFGWAIGLGLLQGLTEFLPVSSSGHLAIAQHFMPGFQQPGLLFDVSLHVGTLAAVCVYFRHDLAALLLGRPHEAGSLSLKERLRLLVLMVAATAVTGTFGMLLKDRVEAAFASLAAVGMGLIVTGVLLLAGAFLARGAVTAGKVERNTGLLDALYVGLMQGLAVMPGISRSGSTISASLARGLDPAWAARFSFLLSIPAVAGAAVLECRECGHAVGGQWPAYVAGSLVAFVSGLLAIKLMMRLVRRGNLNPFAYYCFLMGALVLWAGR
ncbi:MAG: undecaprenyl-diphosphate phosphatase [Pseudomonadota bacterium]